MSALLFANAFEKGTVLILSYHVNIHLGQRYRAAQALLGRASCIAIGHSSSTENVVKRISTPADGLIKKITFSSAKHQRGCLLTLPRARTRLHDRNMF